MTSRDEAALVAKSTDGVPVLVGTDIPVHLVAALAEAGGASEAARAYPSLSRETIGAAVQYARMHPKRGQPYPAKSLKRMLSELALPDDVFDKPVDEPGDDVSTASANTSRPLL